MIGDLAGEWISAGVVAHSLDPDWLPALWEYGRSGGLPVQAQQIIIRHERGSWPDEVLTDAIVPDWIWRDCARDCPPAKAWTIGVFLFRNCMRRMRPGLDEREIRWVTVTLTGVAFQGEGVRALTGTEQCGALPDLKKSPQPSSLADADEPLIIEMRKMITAGKVAGPYPAALAVVDRAAGGGGTLSKARRLERRYTARYG